GGVGLNMTVFEYHGKLLVVDCGVLFPEEDQPGVDLILPDFSYLDDRLDDIVGLVLTPGNEDHIGAVPYLQRRKGDIQIIGSRPSSRSTGSSPSPVWWPRTTSTSSDPSTSNSSPSTTRSPMPWPCSSAPVPATSSTPATSRWTSCRSTAASPTCAPSPASARRAWTCS